MQLVIGYGNTLRSDDGAGVRAAEMLEEIGSYTGTTSPHPLPLLPKEKGKRRVESACDFPSPAGEGLRVRAGTGLDISSPYNDASVGTPFLVSAHLPLPVFGEGLGVGIITAHQLTPELADAVAAADTVIFLDAAEGEPPGSVQISEVQPDEQTRIGVFAHHLTPSALLSAARDLYGSYPRRAYLITITATTFELGEGLSPQVESALPLMVEEAKKLLVDGG